MLGVCACVIISIILCVIMHVVAVKHIMMECRKTTFRYGFFPSLLGYHHNDDIAPNAARLGRYTRGERRRRWCDVTVYIAIVSGGQHTLAARVGDFRPVYRFIVHPRWPEYGAIAPFRSLYVGQTDGSNRRSRCRYVNIDVR